MPTSESYAEGVHELRKTMRDLVALATLPAVWAGYSPDGVARSLADVLLNTLTLDLIYVRVRDRHSAGELEVARGKGRATDATMVRTVATALAPWLTPGVVEPPPSVIDPLGRGDLRVAVA